MEKRGQYSVEFMIFIGFILIVIAVSAYVLFNFSSTAMEGIFQERINDVGETMVNNAREMFYLGLYSKVVVTVNLPSKISNMYTLQITQGANTENYIIFEYPARDGATATIFVASEVPLMTRQADCTDDSAGAVIPECATDTCNLCYFQPKEYSKGPKNFRITHILHPVSSDNVIEIVTEQ